MKTTILPQGKPMNSMIHNSAANVILGLTIVLPAFASKVSFTVAQERDLPFTQIMKYGQIRADTGRHSTIRLAQPLLRADTQQFDSVGLTG